jgi:hypothetical protein
MNQEDIRFDVIRTSGAIITLIFDTARETKLVFRALISLVGTVPGIGLKARPYCIVLDRRTGAWDIWTEMVTPYITEVETGTRYRLTLFDGKIAKNQDTFPVVLRKPTDLVVVVGG